jgi:hypothetical protein
VDEVEFVDARKNDVEPERQAEPETHTDDPNDDCALPFDL